MSICPGCANPVSEMERLTGVCAKDGQPIDQPRVEFRLGQREVCPICKVSTAGGACEHLLKEETNATR